MFSHVDTCMSGFTPLRTNDLIQVHHVAKMVKEDDKRSTAECDSFHMKVYILFRGLCFLGSVTVMLS